MTSLDELLAYETGEPARRASGRVGWWALRAVVASAALGAALVVVLLVLGYELPYPTAAAGILAVLVLHRLVAGLGVRRRVRSATDLEQEPGRRGADGLAPAVHRWHVRMQRKRTLQPSLAELVDERLRLRHGCTRAGDPARARTLLGERLWSYLGDPGARTPSPRDFGAMLKTVEEL
jgi:hypothetical protein